MNDSDYEFTIKFSINAEVHFMTIHAGDSTEAEAIFTEWLFCEAGQLETDHSEGKVWRKIHTGKGQETNFRNDWVASYEVMSKFFMIT